MAWCRIRLYAVRPIQRALNYAPTAVCVARATVDAQWAQRYETKTERSPVCVCPSDFPNLSPLQQRILEML